MLSSGASRYANVEDDNDKIEETRVVTSKPTINKTVGLRVSNLELTINESHLHNLFSQVDDLHSIKLVKDNESGISLGYGYVNYFSKWAALKAKNSFSGVVLHGRPCHIKLQDQEYYSESKKLPVNRFLHVNFLDDSVTETSLKNLFSPYGSVLSVEILPKKGVSRRKAVVEFETTIHATSALKGLDGKVIGTCPVKISYYLCINNQKKLDSNSNITSPTQPRIDTLPPNILKVSGLAPGIKNVELNLLFNLYGEVTSCKIHSESNNQLYAIVEYEYADQAQDAKDATHGQVYRGGKLDIKFLKDHPPIVTDIVNKSECTIKVTNISSIVTENQLKYLFQSYGTINAISIVKDDSRRSLGFGYICFSSYEEALAAQFSLNGQIIEGSPIKVQFVDSDLFKEVLDITSAVDGIAFGSDSDKVLNPKPHQKCDPTPTTSKLPSPFTNYDDLVSQYERDSEAILKSMDEILPPSNNNDYDERQSIAQYLFLILHDRNPAYASQILDLFLESDNRSLRRLCEDDSLLEAAIDEAFDSLVMNLMSD